MGYDMRMETAEPGEGEEVAKARQAFYAACAKRDAADRDSDERKAAQGEVDAAYRAMDAADRSYFRLNIRGMGVARQEMHALGMLDTDGTEPNFPNSKDFGVTSEMWDAEEGDECAELRAFNAAVALITDGQREKPTGIPVHKLGSNDGWLVTPDEIGVALASYERALETAVATGGEVPAYEWWGDWIDYLRRAQTHGGFRVN